MGRNAQALVRGARPLAFQRERRSNRPIVERRGGSPIEHGAPSARCAVHLLGFAALVGVIVSCEGGSPPIDGKVDSTPDDAGVLGPAPDAGTVGTMGRLRVSVNGLAANATSGGVVSVTSESGAPSGTSITLPAPTAGVSEGEIAEHPLGTYHLKHVAPAGYTHVGGDDAETVLIRSSTVSSRRRPTRAATATS